MTGWTVIAACAAAEQRPRAAAVISANDLNLFMMLPEMRRPGRATHDSGGNLNKV
jgi:hypothetical protein